jgi:hypothetical protein
VEIAVELGLPEEILRTGILGESSLPDRHAEDTEKCARDSASLTPTHKNIRSMSRESEVSIAGMVIGFSMNS